MTRERLGRTGFNESYRDQPLYIGVFDNKNDVPALEQSINSSAGASEIITQKKRAPSIQSLDVKNSTTTLLTIPGSNDVEYKIDFKFFRTPVPKTSIFSAVMEFMMTLAQRDHYDLIRNACQATPTDSSWIFVMHQTESNIPLRAFELLGILEALARNAVIRRLYRETRFDFFVNGKFVAGGCVTRPTSSSAWCQDVREGRQLSSLGNFSSLSLRTGLVQT